MRQPRDAHDHREVLSCLAVAQPALASWPYPCSRIREALRHTERERAACWGLRCPGTVPRHDVLQAILRQRCDAEARRHSIVQRISVAEALA